MRFWARVRAVTRGMIAKDGGLRWNPIAAELQSIFNFNSDHAFGSAARGPEWVGNLCERVLYSFELRHRWLRKTSTACSDWKGQRIASRLDAWADDFAQARAPFLSASLLRSTADALPGATTVALSGENLEARSSAARTHSVS